MIVGLLDHHVTRDWGGLTEEYGTIWVIPEDLRGEAGGPITTVLFSEDY